MSLSACLALSSLLFGIGAVGLLARRSLISVLLSLEIMLNATNLAFVSGARHWHQPDGQIAVLFVLVVGAVEVALGLALVIALYRQLGTTAVDEADSLQG